MEEEKQVQKKKLVKFTKTDGRTPTRNGTAGSFNLLAPVEFSLPHGQEKTLSLGLSCDHPVLMFQASSLTRRGVLLVGLDTWDSDAPLAVRLSNVSGETQYFEEGDTLARCTVMDDSDWELA